MYHMFNAPFSFLSSTRWGLVFPFLSFANHSKIKPQRLNLS